MELKLGKISVEVVQKDIKNVHLSVYPPDGKVRISAPNRMTLDTIRTFAITKLGWIKEQQKKLREQERESPREYLDRESHYVWGRRYLLKVIEKDVPPVIELKHNRIYLKLRPGTSEGAKRAFVAGWYREQLRTVVSDIVTRWEPVLGVKLERFFVQHMKTRWGSCNPGGKSIRLNTELAKKPPECLEYIVVHEMAHLLEPTHNERFVALMDSVMPKWQFYRRELNRLPVRHEEWAY